MIKNPVYLSNEEIISLVNNLVSEALTDSNHPWHPEDAYLQVEGAIRHGFSALGFLAHMRRPEKPVTEKSHDVQF